jgi:hypothetical protein
MKRKCKNISQNSKNYNAIRDIAKSKVSWRDRRHRMYENIATDYGLGGRNTIPCRGKKFSSFQSISAGTGAHPASYPMVTGGIKWPGREANRSSPSSA